MLKLKTISSLEKCFLDEDISSKPEYKKGSALLGERFSFEFCYTDDALEVGRVRRDTRLRVESDLSDFISVKVIESVPVRLPAYPGAGDPDFLRTTPGLYPDLLREINEDTVFCPTSYLGSAWVDVDVPSDVLPGIYPIKLIFTDYNDDSVVFGECTFELEVIGAELPRQDITVTQWLHSDCLATYYNVPVFSPRHWEIIRNFVKCAVKNGITMMLTPIFTPALDTIPGRERPTVQLVDVERHGGKWSFGFSNLEKWVKMCLEEGVEHFEMAHLFTQWGAKHAPKVMALTENGYERVFGWETEVSDGDYKDFLSGLIPELIAKLEDLGVAANTVFHISDEPGSEHLEGYLAAKNVVKEKLDGQIIMDALSDFSFWEKGIVERPVVSIDHIEPYIEAGVPGLWTYYCCCQWDKVSNRFLAMPSWRNRIIGQQFFKYDIAGFLQWGFNFYYTQGSERLCDPFECTDGGWWVPAGDAFSVYPAPDGTPMETIHLLCFTQALTDLRAMRLAEKLTSKEAVLSIIESAGAVTFKDWPKGDAQILDVREKINALIKENI